MLFSFQIKYPVAREIDISKERDRKKVRFSHFKLEKKSWPCEGMSKKFEGKKSRKVCSG